MRGVALATVAVGALVLGTSVDRLVGTKLFGWTWDYTAESGAAGSSLTIRPSSPWASCRRVRSPSTGAP